MRRLALPLLLLALFALTPTVPAGWGQGRVTGASYVLGDAGTWELWYFDAEGGRTGIAVEWDGQRFPGSDLDLYLFPPGSFNGRTLTKPPIAWADARANGPSEAIWRDLAPARYEIVVVPHQAVETLYTLHANPGSFGKVVYIFAGIRIDCPPTPCP